MAGKPPPPLTPDRRYIVVRGRLWRAANPHLSAAKRDELTKELMAARRLVRTDPAAARPRVDAAKRALGERGPVWWDDGAPDLNRHLAKNTPYAEWYAGLPPHERRDPALGDPA